MNEEDDIRARQQLATFKQSYLQMKIDNMTTYTKEYIKSIDECDPAGISSSAYFIGELREKLHSEKQYLSRKQEEDLDNLEREYAVQFQRLNIHKVCECKQKAKK